MKPKILIELAGGMITRISATEPVQIILVDYDSIDIGGTPLISIDEKYQPVTDIKTVLDVSDKYEEEVYSELERGKL